MGKNKVNQRLNRKAKKQERKLTEKAEEIEKPVSCCMLMKTTLLITFVM